MVTIKELAQELGISPSTVSIVLGGKAAERKISAATQEAVLQLAAQRNYQPNIAARRLKDRSGADELQVAVFWARDFRTSMIARFLLGLHQELEKHAQPIRLVIFPYETGKLGESHALYSASNCHAAIICNASAEDLQNLQNRPPIIPIVVYNRSSNIFCGATMDHVQVGRLAADALADNQGHHAIIFSSQSMASDLDIRFQSFCSRCEERGMQVEGIFPCRGTAANSYGSMRGLLRQYGADHLPDSIFCDSSVAAHGVLRALWDDNISIPEKVRIVAIENGTENDEFTIPSLSAIHINMEEAAAENIRILLGLVNGSVQAPYTKIIPVEYIPRESCGPLRYR